jgi:hypothetical protein
LAESFVFLTKLNDFFYVGSFVRREIFRQWRKFERERALALRFRLFRVPVPQNIDDIPHRPYPFDQLPPV